jgi:hypothetical protein
MTYLHLRNGIPVAACSIEQTYLPLGNSDVRAIPPSLSRKTDVELFYPSGPVGLATNSLTLRTPNFGDRDRNHYARINRESRGGSLTIFRDPNWPTQRVLVMDFSGVKDTEIVGILTFLETTLGKKVGFRDWEGRLWYGIITNPESPVITNRQNNSDVSIQLDVDSTELHMQVSNSLTLSQISSGVL